MPGTKEIRTKIASVKSTQKITKAMQMVATSKMRRAQDRMKLARPYAQKMRNVIGHLTEANPDYKHPFLQEREVKGVGILKPLPARESVNEGRVNRREFGPGAVVPRVAQADQQARSSLRHLVHSIPFFTEISSMNTT